MNDIFVVYSASDGEVVETSSQTTNPMVKLFCGQFLSAGINEGKMLNISSLFLKRGFRLKIIQSAWSIFSIFIILDLLYATATHFLLLQ